MQLDTRHPCPEFLCLWTDEMFDIHCFTKDSFNKIIFLSRRMIYCIGIPCVLHIAETKKYM